jgi:hypothetical protein
MAIQHSPTLTQTYHQSLHHTRQQSDARISRLRQSHPRNDRQSQKLSSRAGPTNIVDATQAHLQAHPKQFEETTTLDDNRNTQQVPRVQAPLSVPRPHINYNRQITCSMQPQSPVLRVPTDKPPGKLISMPLVATAIKPTSKPAHVLGIKPTTLPADLSKHERHGKQPAARLCKAATPTSPTPCIRT